MRTPAPQLCAPEQDRAPFALGRKLGEIKMLYLFILLLIAAAVFKIVHASKQREKLEAMRQRYRSALNILQSHPEISDHRVAVLQAGRELADYERSINGAGTRGLFDETALANDLNAYGGGSKM